MRRLGDTEAMQKLQERVKNDREKLWERNGGYIPTDPPKPVCSTCNGAGAYLRKRGGDHGSAPGDLVTCPDCLGHGMRDRDRVVEARRSASGMEHKHGVTFEATTPYPWQADMFAAGRNYAQRPDGWIWLTGGVTTGKTHLAYCIGNICIGAGTSVLFQAVPVLLDELRAGYRRDADVGFDDRMERLFRVGVLILDDYGKQATSEWSSEKLYQVTSHRLERSMPTVVTTNLTLSQMDDAGSRLFEHITRTESVLLVPFPDKRPAS